MTEMNIWNRKLWGVEFTSGLIDDKPRLIGAAWMKPKPQSHYDDEPTRAILFNTRAAARSWCKQKMDGYAGQEDCCGRWKFRPVRVQEVVKKI